MPESHPAWRPPGGLYALSLPLLLVGATAIDPVLDPVLGTMSAFAAGAFLVVAEILAVIGTSTEVALERHSRGRVLALAELAGNKPRIDALLVHVPTYEVTARLLRFLGNTMLMVGISYLMFRGDFNGAGLASGSIPWARFGSILALLFGIVFLINDVLVRIVVARRPNQALLAYLPVLQVLRFLLAPLRVPLVLLVRLLFRVNLDAPAPSAREEILETVEEGEREGSFTPEEADMIESIIEMERTVVREVQTPRVDMVMIQEDTPLSEAVAFVNEEGCSRIPVYAKDRDDVVGVLYARDLLSHWGVAETGERGVRTVQGVMRKPFFVPENKPLNDLMKEMRARKVHLAVVLDEFNGTSGLVTIEDLLEEIVGEIEDEYDEEEAHVTEEIGAGRFRVEGRTSLEDLNERLCLDLPIEEDFETLAGLVFDRLGKVPTRGEQVRFGPVVVTVIEVDERTAQTLEVEVITTGAEQT